MSEGRSINGVPSGMIIRTGPGSNYYVHFDKHEATLAEIEGIDWTRPVPVGYGRDEGLPDGYEFRVAKITYSSLPKQYVAELEVGQQYKGDVTGYIARIAEQEQTIAEQKTSISELENELAETDAALVEAEYQIILSDLEGNEDAV